MRLTDRILTLSDKCTEEFVSNAFVLSACGRMGLLPGIRKFNVSIDINGDGVDVVSMDCLGLTRNGSLIDVQYDSNYSNSFDTHVDFPASNLDAKYLLCISVLGGCRDTNDGLCMPLYGFDVFEEDSPVPDHSLPIARIVYDEYCWRADEIDFVPPCLYVKSHVRYEELAQKFLCVLQEINAILPQQLCTEKRDAVKIFWPLVQQLMVTMDKEQDTMTPMSLLANLQKLVSAFYCACSLDEYIAISAPDQYVSFINTVYNYKNAYKIISDGVRLSLLIHDKIRTYSAEPACRVEKEVVLPPSIERRQLSQMIKYGAAQIEITNNAPGATVYYTTDGSTPTKSSKSGNMIVVESGFADNWHKEPPKSVVIKVVAYKNGTYSEVETYNAIIKKGNPFTGRQI